MTVLKRLNNFLEKANVIKIIKFQVRKPIYSDLPGWDIETGVVPPKTSERSVRGTKCGASVSIRIRSRGICWTALRGPDAF